MRATSIKGACLALWVSAAAAQPTLPPLELEDPPPPAAAPDPSTPRPPPDAVHALPDAVVIQERRAQATPATVFEVEIGQLDVVPRKDASEHLQLAPGVFTVNAGGEGHAHSTFMRGFAAGEGQDIEYLLHQVPLNEVSNAHNHGYADVLLVMPEIVRAVQVTEGPFDPAQGDFAFAGSAEYRLGVAQRGSRISQTVGSFGTQRTVGLFAPPSQSEGTFGAFELFRTDGFGPNRAAQRATATGRFEHKPDRASDLGWAATAIAYASRFDQAGVVRQDDHQAGRMGFFDTYDPNQGGESTRLLLFFETEAGPVDARFEQVTFLQRRALRMRANFTGFLNDDLRDDFGNLAVATQQRGDGVEMRYDVMTLGSRGRYRLQAPLWGQEQALALGYAARLDQGETSQRRLRAVTAIPYQRVFDDAFDVMNLAGWARAELQPLGWLAVRGGVRVDAFSFGVEDRDLPDADREGSRVPDQTAQAFGFAVNPRVTVDAAVGATGLHVVGSYGRGTRSSDASALSDNEAAPFAQSHSLDLGVVWRRGALGQDPWAMNVQASYDHTRVEDDLVFDQEAGRNTAVGGSTRHVLLASGRLTLGRWFDGLLNLSWAEASLDLTGERLPYIPRFIGRVDAAVKGELFGWRLGEVPVRGHVGLGFTYVPGRPLPLQQVGDDVAVANLGAGVRLWHTTLGLQARNLLDQRYRQAEFNFPSNFQGPQVAESRVAMRHFAAGEPRVVLATLTLHVEDWLTGAVREESGHAH